MPTLKKKTANKQLSFTFHITRKKEKTNKPKIRQKKIVKIKAKINEITK